MTTKKNTKPEFYAFCKDFNSGKIEKIEVLGWIFDNMLTKRKLLRKEYEDIDKETFRKILKGELMNRFWARCEYEIIACDWPYIEYNVEKASTEQGKSFIGKTGLIHEARPVKLDVYEQLEPNLPVITDLAWAYIESLKKKSKKLNPLEIANTEI